MKNVISEHAHIRLLERSQYYKKDVINSLKCIMKNGVNINDIPNENWRHKRYMYAYSHDKTGKVLKYYYQGFIYIINVKQKRLITFIVSVKNATYQFIA